MNQTVTKVSNDAEFRQALKQLNKTDKRAIAALFVDNVLPLTNDKHIQQAIQTAHKRDASKDELEEVFKAVKKVMIDSRTRCGADCDWDDQAVHFVARAATATVAPEGQCNAPDPLWQVVQSCRMARNCALIAADDDSDNSEAETQYQILYEFLSEN